MLEMSGESFKWIPYLTTVFLKKIPANGRKQASYWEKGPKGLLESVKLAEQRHNHNLEKKRKLKEAEAEKLQVLAKKDEEKEVKVKLRQELHELHSKVLQISDGPAVANDIVMEGNGELKNCPLQNRSTRKELQRAQSKIEAGMKGRQELSEEQQVIKKE